MKSFYNLIIYLFFLISYILICYFAFNKFNWSDLLNLSVTNFYFIPHNLDLIEYLRQKPPKFKYNLNKFKHIISLLTEIPAINKNLIDSKGFVPIHARTLKRNVPDYIKYLRYLLDNKILVSNNQYQAGEFSKGYKFAPQYQTKINIQERNSIKKNKIMKQRNKKQSEFNYLHKWFNPMIRVDMDSAMNYLSQQLLIESRENVGTAMHRFNSNYANIYRIWQCDFYFNVDSNIHRLHTNFTNLKSELRNFITYNGTQLVSVDVVNSQPLISSALLHPNFYKITTDGSERDFSFNCYNISNEISQYFITHKYSLSSLFTSPSIMIPKNEESVVYTGIQRFSEICQNGQIYEYISTKLQDKSLGNYKNRKELKKVVFTTMFTDNRYFGQKEAEPKRLFKELFPGVYDIFSVLKKGNKKFLPILLQSIESKLVLTVIAKRISEEKPNMPIWTIHDSIVCPVGYEHYVTTVIKEEFRKAIGLNAETKYHYWKPENLNSTSTTNSVNFSEPDIT